MKTGLCDERGRSMMAAARRHGALATALGALLWAVLLPLAQAGTIRMQVSCATVGSRLMVTLCNTGDEAAQNVRATATFLGQELQMDNISSFPPNKPRRQSFELNTRGLVGTYPARILVEFEDANAYPFSSSSISMIRGEKARASLLVGAMEKRDFARDAKLPLRINNTGEHEITANCRIVTPRELVAPEPEFQVTVPARGHVERMVRIENLSGTPASNYPLHCLIEHDEEGVHYCSLASTAVTLLAPSATSSRGFWIVAGIGVAVVAVLLVLMLRGKR